MLRQSNPSRLPTTLSLMDGEKDDDMSLYLDRGTFGIFPARICKGLPTNDQVVLAWLWFHSNTDTGECWPSIRTLCAESGLKRSTMFSVLKRLESAGLIDRNPRYAGGVQRSNMYRVLQNPDFTGVQQVYPTVQLMDPPVQQVDTRGPAPAPTRPADGCKGVQLVDTEPKSLNQNQEQRESDDLNY